VESQKQAQQQQLQNVGGITNDVPDNVKEEDPDNIDGGLDANQPSDQSADVQN